MKTRTIVYAGIVAVLIALGGRIGFPIPFLNSNFTLQVLVIYLCAVVLPPMPAFFSVLVYILMGLIGLPVFANGGGLQYVFHPTFGFLLGFLVSAPVMSYIFRNASQKSSFLNTYTKSALVGLVIMYIIGFPYMLGSFSLYLEISNPLSVGIPFLLFIPIDMLKAVLAYPVARLLRREGIVIS